MLLLTVGVAFLLLVALLLVRGSTPRIDPRAHPEGLAALEQVAVNGARQWLLIRSENVHNPVVLFVHGGPGTSQLTLNRRNTRALEKHFTVVNWDQRGAGKSFAAGRDRAGMNVPQFVDDVIDVSSYLAKRFHKERIVLVGHSWGSGISMLAVSRRPDLFAAYVGIGQVSRHAESERLSYDWTLERARARGDRSAVKKLTETGPPPYTGDNWRSKFLTERRHLTKYGGECYEKGTGALGAVLGSLVFSREYTMVDRINYFRGIMRSLDALFPEFFETDLFAQVPEVQVPVYFCLGRHDWEVPAVLSARYFEELKAPRRQLVWFERSGHMPNTEEKDAFNRFMIETVLPAVS